MTIAALLAAFSVLLLASAKLSTGIKELTASNFDAFVEANDKVMVDFVKGSENQTEQLLLALKKIREYGSSVPLARLDVEQHEELAKRFVPTSCDQTNQKCLNRFPQLLWFTHGQATRYHRSLKEAQNIASFVLAMDRELVTPIASEVEVDKWNRLVLYRGEKGSDMYKALERLAAQHMDTLAIAHIQEPGAQNVSWIVDQQVVDEYASTVADVDSIEAWARHHLTWSEDVPLDNVTDDGTVVVVGKTFEALVTRPDRDVFLLVYAPWCGFSRKVLPIWSELSRAASGMEDITIAKMDGTKNSIATHEFYWNSYPTIVFFRAGQTKPILYEGDRTLDGLKTFAEGHSSFMLNFGHEGVVLLQKEANYWSDDDDL